MTIAARLHDADTLGFSFLRRGNSVTVFDMGMPTLGDRLRGGYQDAAVYEPYKESIGELQDAVDRAAADEAMSAEDKVRASIAALHAEDFLTNRPWSVVAPTVDIWENGRVALEWYVRPDRIVTATIDEYGRLAFAGLMGAERTSGLRILEGLWPRELVTWIKRVKE